MKRAGAILLLLGPLLVGGPLGWFLTATVGYHFARQHGPDPVVRDQYVVARSCERQGPVTAHGFGYWHVCRVDSPRGEKYVDFLTPADIGTPVAAVWIKATSGKGSRAAHYERAAASPAGYWVWPILFALAWIGLVVLATRFGARVADRLYPTAVTEDRRRTRVRVGSDWLHPLTLTPQGLRWGRHEMPWREVRDVRLIGDTMHVKPLVGETVTIGPFDGKRLVVVHQALEVFIRNRYRDERVSSAR